MENSRSPSRDYVCHRNVTCNNKPTLYMENTILIKQLDDIIAVFKKMQSISATTDLSSLPKYDRQSLITRCIAAIHRISGENSTYSLEVKRLLQSLPQLHAHTTSIVGIVQALRDDIDSGYIQSLTEIVHAEVFSDFIDMANHLSENGFKDAAAVIAGSTLESHIKKLCIKNGIALESNGKSIKTEMLNQALAKTPNYTLLDQKNVTAWMDFRNKAAHGNYSDYNNDQVKLLISSIQDFITRKPA